MTAAEKKVAAVEKKEAKKLADAKAAEELAAASTDAAQTEEKVAAPVPPTEVKSKKVVSLGIVSDMLPILEKLEINPDQLNAWLGAPKNAELAAQIMGEGAARENRRTVMLGLHVYNSQGMATLPDADPKDLAKPEAQRTPELLAFSRFRREYRVRVGTACGCSICKDGTPMKRCKRLSALAKVGRGSGSGGTVTANESVDTTDILSI